MQTRQILRLGIIYLLVGIGLLFILGPVCYMFTISIRNNADLYARPFAYIPPNPTLDNYLNVLLNRTSTVKANFSDAFVRTLVVSICSSVSAVLLASLAGYSLARFRFRGREPFGLLMLASQMMPAVLFLVPLFIVFRQLRLTNSILGLILSYLTFALPFCIWMLRGYFDSIPAELEESAMIDGCTRLQALRRVVLPLVAPALVATGAYAFILAWNEFLFAFILGGKIPLLSVSMYAFISQYGPEYGNLMAMSVLISLPPVIIFLVLQRYLVAGLTAGAVKT
ncbi:MAG: carbohydrate ABC transporter permease [Anaerolineae bacterium]|nr:carbohydrate ABC transporter permease [Anaerolineae bacterium]